MLNNICLMGRLTRDPELRYTQSKVAVANFTLAVDRNYGEDRQTDFIDCIAWRGTAEFVSRYFLKGSMAVVQGSLQIRNWTDKEGNKRRSGEVVVDSIYFGEGKKRAEDSPEHVPAENCESRIDTAQVYTLLQDIPDDGPLPF